KQAIGINAGLSILPRPTIVAELEMRTLVALPLQLAGVVRPIAIIHRRGKRVAPAGGRFIEQLQKPDESASGGGFCPPPGLSARKLRGQSPRPEWDTDLSALKDA